MAKKPNAILGSLSVDLKWKMWFKKKKDWSNHVERDVKHNWLILTFDVQMPKSWQRKKIHNVKNGEIQIAKTFKKFVFQKIK